MGVILAILIGWGAFATYVDLTSKTDFSSKPPAKAENVQSSRNLNGHLFPTTMLFNSPIPSSRFGFAQGGGIQSIKTIEDVGDEQNPEYVSSEYSYYGLTEDFDIGAKISNKLSLDLDADVFLMGGMEKKNFLSVNISPDGGIKGGLVYKLFQSKKGLLVTLAGRSVYRKGIDVSMQRGLTEALSTLSNQLEDLSIDLSDDIDYQTLIEGLSSGDAPSEELLQSFVTVLSKYKPQLKTAMTDTFKSLTSNLVVKTTTIGTAPSIGVAYPITKWLGVQSSIEYTRVKVTEETKDTISEDTGNWFDFNSALSLDFRNIINFPLCLSIEQVREIEDSISSNTLGAGLYYQGKGEIQMGVFGATKVGSKNEKLMYGQFNITYFF